MNTRLTGRAVHSLERRCTQSASSALPGAVGTTLPSMPAVMRPALTSVTRRTLNWAFARERSINFCRLRTRFRSPACDAAKIRCRSRRTSSSAWSQSISNQVGASSSGPFTTATGAAEAVCVISMASNLSFGSGVQVISSSQAHLIHVGTLSGPGTGPGIRSVVRDERQESRS
jgi:hypothetical protein